MVYIPEKLTGEMRFAIGIRQTLLKKVMVKKTKAKDKDRYQEQNCTYAIVSA